jgi:spermidine synthase
MFPVSFIYGLLFPLAISATSETVKGREQVPFFYGLMSAGGAVGAYSAGFILLPSLGFLTSAIVVTTFTTLLSMVILLLPANKNKTEQGVQKIGLFSYKYLIIAFFSGLCTLGLEMFMIRMFSYVDQNSTYTFSLTICIIQFAFGIAGIASGYFVKKMKEDKLLFIILCIASVSILLIPSIFYNVTEGLFPLGKKLSQGWSGYISEMFTTGITVILFPAILAGMVFPVIMYGSGKLSSKKSNGFGVLLSINTIGAVIGLVLAVFIFPGTFGLWKSIFIISIIYLICALVSSYNKKTLVISVSMLTAFSVFAINANQPLLRPELSNQDGEMKVLDFHEDCAGSIAVVQSPDNLRILLNNKYFLGGTRSQFDEEIQSIIPIAIHHNPKKVYYIGLGTGISAGAALRFPVEKVTVSEIIPGLISVAQKWFDPYTHGLFYDHRVSIIPEDGRWLLAGSSEKYDVIISDLVVPWEIGAGNLFSQEHFRNVKEKLNNRGHFALWLPLYQMSRSDFDIIQNTMMSVFSQVTLWRGDFAPQSPSVCLIGYENQEKLDPIVVKNNLNSVKFDNEINGQLDLSKILQFYCGNLKCDITQRGKVPINTDDNMLVEYKTPVEQCNVHTNKVKWFSGNELISYMEYLLSSNPSKDDQYLLKIPSDTSLYVEQGLKLYKTAGGLY